MNRRRASISILVWCSGSRPSWPGMCGQLHHTTPGRGVSSHHISHDPPRSCLTSRSSCWAAAGSARSNAIAASVSTSASRWTSVMMYEPWTPGAPALAKTSPSPVPSITTRPRIACRPAHGHLSLAAHVVEQEDHAAGGQAAEIAEALEQHHLGARPRGGDGGRLAGRSAANDKNVRLGNHGSLSARLVHHRHDDCPSLNAPIAPAATPGYLP